MASFDAQQALRRRAGCSWREWDVRLKRLGCFERVHRALFFAHDGALVRFPTAATEGPYSLAFNSRRRRNLADSYNVFVGRRLCDGEAFVEFSIESCSDVSSLCCVGGRRR